MTTGVRVLDDTEVDPSQEAVDIMLTEAEEAELQALLNPNSTPKYDETLDDDTPDPVAKTYPTEDGVKAVGRAVAAGAGKGRRPAHRPERDKAPRRESARSGI